jgi:Uma2 family endonuclease
MPSRSTLKASRAVLKSSFRMASPTFTPSRPWPTWPSGAPDLAVEVLSPSDDPVDVQQKIRDYFDAGAHLVWVIAPAARSATVYRADGSARLLREGDHLDGEDALPGLLIPLSELFD